MTICPLVHLNGALTPLAEAHISPLDRGFLFAHAAYEVTAVYGGRFVDLEGHITRLERTLAGISIPNPHSSEGWANLHRELIAHNDLVEGLVYLQVTGGAYDARDFAGPQSFMPTVFAYADRKALIGASAREGVAAVFIEDSRWKKRDMKTTQLLSQALAYRAAKGQGAETALMVEDGLVTEAASANAWIVTGEGEIITRNLSPSILSGITRAGVMKLRETGGFTITERAFTPEEAVNASEVFTSSAGAMIAPVVTLDGRPVGDGRPGPVTRRVQKLYYEAMGADVAVAAPFVFDRD
ncbi:putative D-alanine aminotransferase [Hyphomonas neptunium ATCC 15444]|uniref:Probable branched-chain-amino-acid aminotransferase n=2 Tax=Hyphomonas TaxID=85 RepID=Q0BXK0_HYPNA|nr:MULTISPECIES: aminotransferase class IV [Hyphomonas]ABI77993.1 putative D-alanine aminotransferase [Hyphomonas neptunium ATCC 15444]KCZ89903.1 putative D-alanine aminotransferase [Hyphomonas hirschiana VP5]